MSIQKRGWSSRKNSRGKVNCAAVGGKRRGAGLAWWDEPARGWGSLPKPKISVVLEKRTSMQKLGKEIPPHVSQSAGIELEGSIRTRECCQLLYRMGRSTKMVLWQKENYKNTGNLLLETFASSLKWTWGSLSLPTCLLHSNPKAICSLCSTTPYWTWTRMDTKCVLPAGFAVVTRWFTDKCILISPGFCFLWSSGATFALVTQTEAEQSPKVDSDIWMGINCPWELAASLGDGDREGDPLWTRGFD